MGERSERMRREAAEIKAAPGPRGLNRAAEAEFLRNNSLQCRYCRKDLDLKASICPYCHAPVLRPWVWKAVLIGFAAITLLIVLIQLVSHR
jgi:hypothetical protein